MANLRQKGISKEKGKGFYMKRKVTGIVEDWSNAKMLQSVILVSEPKPIFHNVCLKYFI